VTATLVAIVWLAAWMMVAPDLPQLYWRTWRGRRAYAAALSAELSAAGGLPVKEAYERARDRWNAVPYGNASDAVFRPMRYYRDRLRYETRLAVLQQLGDEYDCFLKKSLTETSLLIAQSLRSRPSKPWEVN